MVSLVLEQAKDTEVTEIPAWSVSSVDIPGSRVLLISPVSVDSVDAVMSVVVMKFVSSEVSNCLGRL